MRDKLKIYLKTNFPFLKQDENGEFSFSQLFGVWIGSILALLYRISIMTLILYGAFTLAPDTELWKYVCTFVYFDIGVYIYAFLYTFIINSIKKLKTSK